MNRGLGEGQVNRKVHDRSSVTKRENVYVRGTTKLFLVRANTCFSCFVTFAGLETFSIFVHLHRKLKGLDFKNVQNARSHFCEKEVQTGVKWHANEAVWGAQTRAREAFRSRHFAHLFGLFTLIILILFPITFLSK